MKKLLSFITIAAVVTACNTTPRNGVDAFVVSPGAEKTITADTAGLAKFQAWKAQHELSNANEYNTTYALRATRVVKTYVPVSQPVKNYPAAAKSSDVYNSGPMTSQSSNTAMRKTGWSKAAKGATLGAGAGAVIGAIVSKNNRASGAVIGGIIGGGAGYGIGRTIDKKDGRY